MKTLRINIYDLSELKTLTFIIFFKIHLDFYSYGQIQ